MKWFRVVIKYEDLVQAEDEKDAIFEIVKELSSKGIDTIKLDEGEAQEVDVINKV